MPGETNPAYKHGHTNGGKFSPTYQSWATMHVRCSNPKSAHYRRYGGRGITVCEQWKSFENFLRDMGVRPDGTSLDRIDNDGNYEQTNCRWADKTTQARNASHVVWVTIGGERKRLVDWVDELGMNMNTVRARVKYQGMTYEQALLKPTTRPNGKKAMGFEQGDPRNPKLRPKRERR